MGKFINPFTDFGFHRIFGQEVHKELLIDFLNQLLEAYGYIRQNAFQGTKGRIRQTARSGGCG
ncbi:PD-(D/E)XK nuclease family transposase [Parabacteroides chongii]|uniref:PD-(D/E)XK nuclease family transposase n=1 Tax=uncultured Parabacteroides sp. TaxID=512312 RepID=UPI0031F435AA